MSWFQNLQKQAQDALKVVQEDLAEFGKTVKDDTEEVVRALHARGVDITVSSEHVGLRARPFVACGAQDPRAFVPVGFAPVRVVASRAF